MLFGSGEGGWKRKGAVPSNRRKAIKSDVSEAFKPARRGVGTQKNLDFKGGQKYVNLHEIAPRGEQQHKKSFQTCLSEGSGSPKH